MHVNDLSGMSSSGAGGNVAAPTASGTSALLNNANGSSISPDSHFRAEYKLLTDFLVSVPKVCDGPCNASTVDIYMSLHLLS